MKLLRDMIVTSCYLALILLVGLFLVVALSSCAVEVKQKKDFIIQHKHSIDIASLKEYFVGACLNEDPNYTTEQAETCADEKIYDLLKSIS
jgi:hypothetical protein